MYEYAKVLHRDMQRDASHYRLAHSVQRRPHSVIGAGARRVGRQLERMARSLDRLPVE